MKKLIRIITTLLIPLIFVGCAMNQSLHIPASEGDLDKVRSEIEAGKNVDSKDAAGQTSLMYAAETGRMDVLKYLISKGADVNAESQGYGRGSALIYAASSNRLEAMKFLIENGADASIKNRDDKTALDIARKLNQVAVAQVLENQ